MKKRLELTPELKAMIEAAPEFTFEELGIPEPSGPVIARGYAEFQEYLKKQAQKKTKDSKVLTSIPRSRAKRR